MPTITFKVTSREAARIRELARREGLWAPTRCRRGPIGPRRRSRPQFFAGALGDALNPLTSRGGRFEQQVRDAAQQRLRDDEGHMESEYLSLKPIEQAVLWRLLEQGNRFRPYDADALRFYRDKVGQARVTAQQAQAALETIRSRTPAVVWKSARGEYAVDDAMMHGWYMVRVAAGT